MSLTTVFWSTVLLVLALAWLGFTRREVRVVVVGWLLLLAATGLVG